MVLSTMSCKHATERKKVNVKFNICMYYTLNVYFCVIFIMYNSVLLMCIIQIHEMSNTVTFEYIIIMYFVKLSGSSSINLVFYTILT